MTMEMECVEKKGNRKKNGMTLVELMVSLALIAILLTVFTGILMTSFRIVLNSENNTSEKNNALSIVDGYRAGNNSGEELNMEDGKVTVSYENSTELKEIAGKYWSSNSSEEDGDLSEMKGFIP